MMKLQRLSACAIALGLAFVNPTVIGAKSPGLVPDSITQQGKTPPATKVVPHPKDWITYTDSKKGYSFDVPAGTEGEVSKDGIMEVYAAVTPSRIAVVVLTFKDPKKTKNDLLNLATGTLKSIGNKDVGFENLEDLSDDYALADYFGVTPTGAHFKGKVLVALDRTDNYVMLLGTEDKDFKANEKIIDEIWGSFSMKSGGASGKS